MWTKGRILRFWLRNWVSVFSAVSGEMGNAEQTSCSEQSPGEAAVDGGDGRVVEI